MNQQELIQRLSEFSGMARSIMLISEDENIEVIAYHLEDYIDSLVEELQSEEDLEFRSRFQALHPCEHEWKQSAPGEFMCLKCGERGE
jgi:hypothetical protein